MKVYTVLNTWTHNGRPLGPGQHVALNDAQAEVQKRRGFIASEPYSTDPALAKELDFASRAADRSKSCCFG